MLGKKYREKAFIEEKTLPKKSLTDVPWFFAFLPYRTNWAKYKN
jgi:hypothetical protein